MSGRCAEPMKTPDGSRLWPTVRMARGFSMGLFTLPTRRATRYFNPCSVACFYQSQYMPKSFNTCVQWD
jgi:hypothetical protein